MNHSYPKTTFASDAFYKAMLGQEVTMTINTLGTETFVLHQVDQFTLVVETEDGKFLLLAKSAIIAVEALDTALPAFHEAIAEGVKMIQYKASKPRTENNKAKFQKKPHFQRPQFNDGPREAPAPREVQVVVKPKRTFDRG
jgi:hypothetical protein